MKKSINYILLGLAVVCVVGYVSAELIIRGEALNRISFGIGGWFLCGGILLLIVCWGILPVFSFFFGFFPKWIDPKDISTNSERLEFLEKYGHFLLNQYKKNPPEEIADDIQKLNELFAKNGTDPAQYLDELLQLVQGIRQNIIDRISKRIIHDYMKKTAVWVMISQRGFLDSIAMFVMQMRLAADLGKTYGYHLSWVFICYYSFWIFINSIFFALFDGTDYLDDSMNDLIGMIAGEKLGSAIPIFGKVSGIMIQGATSMAIVYASGRIVQNRLLGNSKRASQKERIQYRLDGLKEAIKLYPSLIKGTATVITGESK